MKMKRLFTFLMAILALLSISQTVKAADVTVYFQRPDGWSTPVFMTMLVTIIKNGKMPKHVLLITPLQV